MVIIQIKWRILDSITINWETCSYSKQVESGYSQKTSKYNLVVIPDKKVFDPRDATLKELIEIPFESEESLNKYVEELEAGTSKDLIYIYGDKEEIQISITGGANLSKTTLSVTSNGQTIFLLPAIVSYNSLLFVNGHKMKHPEDYTISGLILTFLNRHFTLSTSDEVELFY